MSKPETIPEAEIQKKAIRYASQFNIPSIRMVFRHGLRSGWPDVLFLIPGGRPLFIEFKAPGRNPTPLQQHRIDELRGLGYDVCIADNKNEACGAIARAVGAASLSGKSR